MSPTLKTLIDNRENISPCHFFINRFNVKKFCKIHNLHYSYIPTYFKGKKGFLDIKELHNALKNISNFSKQAIIVHIDYSKSMNSVDLGVLFSDLELDKRIILIPTNNKRIKNQPFKGIDFAINYMEKSRVGKVKEWVHKAFKAAVS